MKNALFSIKILVLIVMAILILSHSGVTHPIVTTTTVSAVTANGATINGHMTNKGTATSVTVSFQYGPTTNYGFTAAAVPASLSAPKNMAKSLYDAMYSRPSNELARPSFAPAVI